NGVPMKIPLSVVYFTKYATERGINRKHSLSSKNLSIVHLMVRHKAFSVYRPEFISQIFIVFDHSRERLHGGVLRRRVVKQYHDMMVLIRRRVLDDLVRTAD